MSGLKGAPSLELDDHQALDEQIGAELSGELTTEIHCCRCLALDGESLRAHHDRHRSLVDRLEEPGPQLVVDREEGVEDAIGQVRMSENRECLGSGGCRPRINAEGRG